MLVPQAITGSPARLCGTFAALDLVSSFLDPCGPSSQDQTAAGLGHIPHPLSGGRKYLLGPELSITTLPLQPEICFKPQVLWSHKWLGLQAWPPT